MTDRTADGEHRLRLAFDGTPLFGDRTGVGHVTASMLDHLAGRPDLDVVVYAVTRTGRRDLAGVLPTGIRAGTSVLPARVALPSWRLLGRPRIEHWTGVVDVVHATNYIAPPAKAPVLVTVHDVTFHRFPELCSPTSHDFGALVRSSVRAGAFVHVISDFVGFEVREMYGLPPERVVRVYPGLDTVTGGERDSGRRLAAADRYILALGTIEPRKNLPRLVAAFDVVAAGRDDVHLVVAGPDGWGERDFTEAVGRARHRTRIRRLGYLSDVERRDLLAGATVLAYPSLYEGFGLPPLEAMAAGVPVVAARAGSLPEVLGDAALLASPTDEEELAQRLAEVLDDADTRTALVERGRIRAARYRWDRAADELVALYRRLALTER